MSCWRSDPSAESAQNVSPGAKEELKDDVPGKFPTSASFPKSSGGWGYAGSRYQGPTRGFSVRAAASFQDLVGIASELPFPTTDDFHGLPDDLRETAKSPAGLGLPRIKEFRGNQLAEVANRARPLAPRLNAIRDKVSLDPYATRARLHIPLLEELIKNHGVGGGAWRSQVAYGCLNLGDISEPGAFTVRSGIGRPMSLGRARSDC